MKRTHKEIPAGTRFGMLEVVSLFDGVKGRWRYSMQCDCGGSSIAYASHLMSGATRSCGCRNGPIKHGGTLHGKPTPEYRTWNNMRNRCFCVTCPEYFRYGGRGITICERWLKFENFLADMGPKPSPKHSIDRINNDGNYEPGNCRWATPAEQSRNTRKTIKVGGLCLKDACAQRGIEYGMAQARIYHGEDPESAVARPPKAIKHMLGGVPMADAARKAGIPYRLVLWRMQNGWSEEDILSVPASKGNRTKGEDHANTV